jgi:hypothetical protein
MTTLKLTPPGEPLLPCPFCGSVHQTITQEGECGERNGYNFMVVLRCKCGVWIGRASRRDANGWCNDNGEALKNVVEGWNARITPALRKGRRGR